MAFRTRKEDESRSLVLHQSADIGALLLGELVVADAHIAEENHIVFGEVLDFFWEFIDVIRTTADAQLRMKKQAGELNSRVAREGIAQEAVFPTRQ